MQIFNMGLYEKRPSLTWLPMEPMVPYGNCAILSSLTWKSKRKDPL